MSYLVLLAPSANRVYTDRAVDLSVAELMILGQGVIDSVEPVELAGVWYLAVESGQPEHDVAAVLGRASACWAVFAREGDVLRPVRRPVHDRLDDDLVTIPKYPGKTNEQFTRLMINVATASAPRLNGTSAQAGGHAPSLLDPMCGRGTTLSLGLTLGFDVAGVDTDLKAIEAYAAFLKTYLRRKRLKHSCELTPVKREGRSIGRRLDATVGTADSDRRSTLTVFSGDTRDSAALFGKRRFDLVVTDAPYGIVHTGRGPGPSSGRQPGGNKRSTATLLEEAIGGWAGQLKHGGALALSWNTLGLAREELDGVAQAAGLRPLASGPYLQLAHRVDASIRRDLFVAVRD